MDEAGVNSLWTKLEVCINALRKDLSEQKVKLDLEDGGKSELDLAQVMSNVRNLIRGFVDLGRYLKESLDDSHLKEKENSALKMELASVSEQLKQISSGRGHIPSFKQNFNPAGASSEATSRNGERVRSSAATPPAVNSSEERRSKKRRFSGNLTQDVKEAEDDSPPASPRTMESPTTFPNTQARDATEQTRTNVASLRPSIPTGETGFIEGKDCSGAHFIPRRKRSVRALVINRKTLDGQRKRIAELEEKLTCRVTQVEYLKSLVKRTHLNWRQHTVDMRRQCHNMKILVSRYQRILGEEMAVRRNLEVCYHNVKNEDVEQIARRPQISFSTTEMKKMEDYIMEATDAFLESRLNAFLEENPPGGVERYELERKTLKLEQDITVMQINHKVATDRVEALHSELIAEQSRVKALCGELQVEQNKVRRIEAMWRSFSSFGFEITGT